MPFLVWSSTHKPQQSLEDIFNGLSTTSLLPQLAPHTQTDNIVPWISSTKRSLRVKQDSKTPNFHCLVRNDAQDFCWPFYRWVPSLSATFSEQGLIDVQRGQYAVKPHFRSFFTQMTCMSVEEFSWAVLDNSSAEGSGPLCRRVIKEASEELKDGFALNYILEAVIGRKAFS